VFKKTGFISLIDILTYLLLDQIGALVNNNLILKDVFLVYKIKFLVRRNIVYNITTCNT
jgi:hypothetical protein